MAKTVKHNVFPDMGHKDKTEAAATPPTSDVEVTPTDNPAVEQGIVEMEKTAEMSSVVNAMIEAAKSTGRIPAQPVAVSPEVLNGLNQLTTISSKIRYLAANDLTRGQIAKVLSVHRGRTVLYQHVRNVLITPVKNKVS